MDSSSNTTNENSERDPARLSSKDKFERFVQDNKIAIIVVSAIVGVLLFVGLLYFFIYYESKMERFANDFCTCAEASTSDFYANTKDGFGYRSDMADCFGRDFSAYGQRYDKSTKRLLLEDFKEAVIEKCPQQLDKVFKYE